MSVRPLSFSKWLSQPTQILQRSLSRAAAQPAHPFLLRQLPRASSRTLTTATKSSTPLPRARLPRFRSFQRQPRRFNSGTSSTATKKEGSSLGDRLRKLTKEYGWAAVGVYLTLSALDFPLCFLGVELLGVERVGHYERIVVESVKDKLPALWPKPAEPTPEEETTAVVEDENSENASIWTRLALAYAIHKTVFIFVRVPLTAAITPKVVKTLRAWGWKIGKTKPKST